MTSGATAAGIAVVLAHNGDRITRTAPHTNVRTVPG